LVQVGRSWLSFSTSLANRNISLFSRLLFFFFSFCIYSLFSNLYAPSLGPAVRKAVGGHDMDMILDGEVLAWDDVKKETVPFGSNRTIAILRRKWLDKNGLYEDIDKNMHTGKMENKAMKTTDDGAAYCERTAEACWLMFVAFDIVYINGPGAEKMLEETVSKATRPRPVPGSLIELDNFERKKLLHRIIKEQEHQVEIVNTHIVRPNGQAVSGKDYFSPTNPVCEHGYPAYILDSPECIVGDSIPDFARIERERRHELPSDEQISQLRARKIDAIYKQICDEQRLEGLIFKDLSAPYYLGDASRHYRYWLKFKPDYHNGSVASDLDLVIIGAYYATGLRGGMPSSFLCAVVENDDTNFFLPICKVNAGSIESKERGKIFEKTGFKFSKDNPLNVEFGKWFELDDKSIPDFISQSYGTWKAGRDEYPNIWIRPDQSYSVVVTVNAGEIVSSDAYPAGLTLRFARITKVRRDGDEKSPHEIETERDILEKYREVELSRRAKSSMVGGSVDLGSSTSAADSSSYCRFLTESQFAAKKKAKRKSKRTTELPSVRAVVGDIERVSNVLGGLTFTVYDGIYSLKDNEIDLATAHAEGWFDEAKFVRNSRSVAHFIKKHGGMVRLAPGDDTLFIGGRK